MATTTKNGRKQASPDTIKSINPRTGEVLREIETTPIEEIPIIVERARKMAPEWAGIGVEGRSRLLKEVKHRIHERIDEIVEVVSAESGKSPQEVLNLEILPTMMLLHSMDGIAAKALKPEKAGGLVAPLIFGTRSRIEWRPYGVVGAITPWNYPLTNCFLGFLGALYAGNTVVCKPSEVTPASGELVGELLDALPPSVFTVIQGGGEVGAALVEAPCDKISFIGSPPTGRKIMEAAAKHLVPTVMELGGKDAVYVADDADLEVASSGVAWGSFYNAGQTCCSMERVFVHEAIADRFEERLVEKVSRISRGEGDVPMGPLTLKPQLDKVERQVREAVDKGARVLTGGPEAWAQSQGFWFAPTVLADVTDEMEVFAEESFGPIVTLTRVSDDEDAIRRVNEEGVNLTASVWSTDRKRVERVSARLKAGVLSGNEHGALPAMGWAPWGGTGESGFGRLNGVYGVREFAVPTHHAQSVTPKMHKPYWFPYNTAQQQTIKGIIGAIGERTTAKKLAGISKIASAYVSTMRSRL